MTYEDIVAAKGRLEALDLRGVSSWADAMRMVTSALYDGELDKQVPCESVRLMLISVLGALAQWARVPDDRLADLSPSFDRLKLLRVSICALGWDTTWDADGILWDLRPNETGIARIERACRAEYERDQWRKKCETEAQNVDKARSELHAAGSRIFVLEILATQMCRELAEKYAEETGALPDESWYWFERLGALDVKMGELEEYHE